MWILNQMSNFQNSTKTAVIFGQERLTFKQLWQRSEAFCGYLHAFYDAKEDVHAPLVIYGSKQSDIIPVMHGALKFGIPYVPVDTLYPVDRLQQIIGQVHAGLVVNFSQREVKGDFTVLDAPKVQELFSKYQNYISDPTGWVHDEDICYILFTSGSTGKPKGVQITKSNLLCFTNWYKEFCPVNDATVALNQVSYSFDVSVMSLYIYLAQGATLFSVDATMLADFKLLEAAFLNSGLTDWVSTPALFDICTFAANFNKQLLPALKRFSFAGEVLTKKLVRTVKERFGQDAVVINGYGPTETTVLLTACEVTEAMLNAADNIPIGRLNPALHMNIVSENGNHLEAEEAKGELWVRGGSISPGYYHNSGQTGKYFNYTAQGERCYRTGDLVFRRGDLLYYCERKDFQIKLNGYRIEPDDISTNIIKFDFVQNSIVLPVLENGKVVYLAAYVQLKEHMKGLSTLQTAIMIKKQLKEVVPVYMIPKKVIVVERFPLNVNGKIDRKKLLEEL